MPSLKSRCILDMLVLYMCCVVCILYYMPQVDNDSSDAIWIVY